MKLLIQPRPRSLGIESWTECEPFVENTRAVLIHRVRHVELHKIGDKWPAHLAVHAWCGNGYTGMKKFTFLDDLPAGRLLCQRCEVTATANDQPSAEQLVGRHVHLGKVVAQQVCCQATKEQP